MDNENSTGPRGTPRSVAVFALVILFVSLAAFTVLLASGITLRGPWYDEFYTLYVTSPRFAWGDALQRHWLPDNHPPLYYIVARGTAWLGDTVEPRRWVNGLILLAATGAGIAMSYRRGQAVLLAVFVLTLLAQPTTIGFAVELRSYFLSICLSALVVLGLALAWRDAAPFSRGGRLALSVAIFLAFNVHIVTSIIIAALLTPFLAVAWARRDTALLRLIGLPAIAGGLVLIVVTAVQIPMWLSNTRNFWIAHGLAHAVDAVHSMISKEIRAALPIMALAAAGFAWAAFDSARARRLNREIEESALFAAGMALASALLIALHLVRPMLIEKYLVPFGPPLAIIAALGCRALIVRLKARPLVAAGLMTLLVPASLQAELHAYDMAIHRSSWRGTASAIAKVASDCPGTAVHLDGWFNRDLRAMSPADNGAVLDIAYPMIAHAYGFHLEPANSRAMSPRCPTLFWAEHQTIAVSDAQIAAHLRAAGFRFSSLDVTRIGDGWVASANE